MKVLAVDGGEGEGGGGAGSAAELRRTVDAPPAHLQRILNLVIFWTPFAVFFLIVITLTLFASFLRAVVKNCLISVISLGLSEGRGGGGGMRGVGKSAARAATRAREEGNGPATHILENCSSETESAGGRRRRAGQR